jgi:hypothetical protein
MYIYKESVNLLELAIHEKKVRMYILYENIYINI